MKCTNIETFEICTRFLLCTFHEWLVNSISILYYLSSAWQIYPKQLIIIIKKYPLIWTYYYPNTFPLMLMHFAIKILVSLGYLFKPLLIDTARAIDKASNLLYVSIVLIQLCTTLNQSCQVKQTKCYVHVIYILWHRYMVTACYSTGVSVATYSLNIIKPRFKCICPFLLVDTFRH